MRRVLLAIAGTVAGLVALLSFKSHSGIPSSAAATAGTSGGSSSAGSPAGSGSSAASGVANGYKGGGYTTGAIKLISGEKSVLGKAASTVYGPVQVQLVVSNHKIVNVGILQQPQGTPHDLQIGQLSFPTLIKETITAQSGKVDAVSGATYTSGGYIQSLQSAVDKGL